MRVVDIFVRRPVLAIVLNLALVAIGLRAASQLPVQQYPRIESSSIIITTVYVGASAEGIRGFVTTPVERAVSSITGIDYVESSSRPGSEHGHRPAETQPPEHGGAGRGRQSARSDPQRAADRHRVAGRRGPARGPALRHVLRQCHVGGARPRRN